jgi:bromodomain and WD repeat domain containing protein 1/3
MQILAAVNDHTLRVWDTATGEQLHILRVHTEPVYVLECHPHDPRLAMSASYDGLTVVWDIEKGKDIARCFFSASLMCGI